MSKTIYIVLTETGSVLSRAIQVYTQENFNHISIAFDPELKEMYSFGRKHENNPLIGGFVQEDAQSKLLREANCAIYQLTVSNTQYEKLRMEIAYFKQYKNKFKYNFIGLFCVAFRIRLKRDYAFFCSQFIAFLFLRAGISIDLCPYFIKPTDFQYIQGIKLCYKGKLTTYRTQSIQHMPIASIIKIA
ncbi:hypothetical protein [Lysinibacillus sp. LZ02]|uniref:hypothetical protein n=1 Tax=Lysinibacillus sp. LZ02 TaxID=3420668 RepID=UPI003D36368B